MLHSLRLVMPCAPHEVLLVVHVHCSGVNTGVSHVWRSVVWKCSIGDTTAASHWNPVCEGGVYAPSPLIGAGPR